MNLHDMRFRDAPAQQGGGTVLIAGAGSDIAYELAGLLAAGGQPLVLVARSEREPERIAARLCRQHAVAVHPIALDLSDPQAPYALHEEISERGIAVNDLVNDTGALACGSFGEAELDRVLREVQLSINTSVVLTKLFLREMRARGTGRILQRVPGEMSADGARASAICSGCRAFVLNFTRALAGELRGTGVSLAILQGSKAGTAAEEALHAYRVLMDTRTAESSVA